MTSLQDFLVTDDAPKDSSFGPTFFLQVVIFLMLFVILLPMVMILLSTVSRIKLLIYGNNWSGLLNLTEEAMRTGVGSDLLISILGKLNLLCLMDHIIHFLLMIKCMGLSLVKNQDLRCWGYLSLQTATHPSKKIESLIRSMKFLYSEVALYLNKSSTWAYVEYYCHVYDGASNYYLDMLHKLQKQVWRTVESLAHCWNEVSQSNFYRYYFGRCSSELT